MDTVRHTRARNTYVDRTVASLLPVSPAEAPLRTGLGGQMREARDVAVLKAKIEGHAITTHAFVLDDIGRDEDGKPIEILFGALAMQQWGIRPIPDTESLDLSHYPTEFIEF